MGRIYSKKLVEGVSIPGIIHNGSYFFTRLGVYEDGTVSCWHKSDLWQFEGDLQKGWVTPLIPVGKCLSVHALCALPVLEARWLYDQNGFYQHVKDVVKQLNPEMKNIYRTTQREIQKWESHRVQWSATPTPYKLDGKMGYRLLDGKESHVFYRSPDKLCLTSITAYADKTLKIEAFGEQSFTIEEINAFFQNKTLCTSPQENEWVTIDGLGEIRAGEAEYSVEPEEKRKEILETLKRICGEKDAHDACMDAYYQYLAEPGEWQREQLRKAYEAVPEHERMYLGDMDSRDTDFQRILYAPEEKREV